MNNFVVGEVRQPAVLTMQLVGRGEQQGLPSEGHPRKLVGACEEKESHAALLEGWRSREPESKTAMSV